MNSRRNCGSALHFATCLLAGLSGACDGGSTEPLAAGGTVATSGGASTLGGTSASGGSRGSTTNAGAGVPATNGSLVLSWEDNFDSLDSSLWALQTFSWDGNLAQFATTNASVADGILTMSLTNGPSGATKPYLGAEVRSTKTFTYGKVSARMRFASGSGVVSGLVLFYTPWPNCDWNEIDIEHLGKSPTSSQLNAMVYTGAYNAGCTASVTPIQEPLIVDLGFDAEADFHLYDIEWTPSYVKYYADAKLLRTWSTNIALLKRPMNILLTIWASNAASWAGAVDAATAPRSAQLDWIKVYEYK